jgi:hypothetical protein
VGPRVGTPPPPPPGSGGGGPGPDGGWLFAAAFFAFSSSSFLLTRSVNFSWAPWIAWKIGVVKGFLSGWYFNAIFLYAFLTSIVCAFKTRSSASCGELASEHKPCCNNSPTLIEPTGGRKGEKLAPPAPEAVPAPEATDGDEVREWSERSCFKRSSKPSRIDEPICVLINCCACFAIDGVT